MKYVALYADGEWHSGYQVGANFTSLCSGGDQVSMQRDAADRQRRLDREVAASLAERDRLYAGTARRLGPWYDEREAR